MKRNPRTQAEKKTRKDYIGKSGVYPMSGPHPTGEAPIRGQMEWGQGERGAAGYYDHGTSELSMVSGLVLGAFDQSWSGVPEPGAAIPPVSEIPVAEWPAFCNWLTKSCRGVIASLESEEQGQRVVQARDRPFEEITAHLLENLVPAITIVLRGKPEKIRVNVTGPRSLKIRRNPAGWPIALEIDSGEGPAILHFTGEVKTEPGMSSNAWGE